MAQLFIGQLPFSKFFPDDLLNLFRPYGNVVAHQLHIRQGNAFVTYATTDEADAAIQALHGQCALGTRSQPIQVMYSKGTRLISPFGLQHRSMCLARNKDRQKSAHDANGHSTTSNSNNDHNVSLNDGAFAGMAMAPPMPYTAAMFYTTTAGDDASTHGNMSGAGVASFLSRGPSDISFEEDSRQTVGGHVLSNASTHSLNASAGRYTASHTVYQYPHHQPPAPQPYLPGIFAVDPMVYGSPVKWAMTPPTVLMPAVPPAQTPSNGPPSPPSRLSSPAAPPLPPSSLSYVMVQPAPPPPPPHPQAQAQAPQPGMNSAFGMPICYVVPASAAAAYAQQQQQQQQQGSMTPLFAPFGSSAMMQQSGVTSMQMRPM